MEVSALQRASNSPLGLNCPNFGQSLALWLFGSAGRRTERENKVSIREQENNKHCVTYNALVRAAASTTINSNDPRPLPPSRLKDGRIRSPAGFCCPVGS